MHAVEQTPSPRLGIQHGRSQTLIEFAFRFARDAHASIDQRRKYTGEPYIVHPVAVTQTVARVTDDCEMICAALLHDVVEDTPVTLEQIRDAGFGAPIARLVEELTDVNPPGSNRAQRHQLALARLADASPRAQTIKLADMIDNTRSIALHDPNFARVYMAEKQDVLRVLTRGDRLLRDWATSLMDIYFAA